MKIKRRIDKELKQHFDHFPKHGMKILLGASKEKLERENISKPTIGNESLH